MSSILLYTISIRLRNCVDLKCLLDFESLKFKTKKRTSIRLNEEDKEIEAELEKLQEPGKSYIS